MTKMDHAVPESGERGVVRARHSRVFLSVQPPTPEEEAKRRFPSGPAALSRPCINRRWCSSGRSMPSASAIDYPFLKGTFHARSHPIQSNIMHDSVQNCLLSSNLPGTTPTAFPAPSEGSCPDVVYEPHKYTLVDRLRGIFSVALPKKKRAIGDQRSLQPQQEVTYATLFHDFNSG
jgi:hypothetical protein